MDFDAIKRVGRNASHETNTDKRVTATAKATIIGQEMG